MNGYSGNVAKKITSKGKFTKEKIEKELYFILDT